MQYDTIEVIPFDVFFDLTVFIHFWFFSNTTMLVVWDLLILSACLVLYLLMDARNNVS